MWLFAVVSLAICTPCFRSALEAYFAELSIVFFNHLVLVALATTLAFVAALALHYTLAHQTQTHQQQASATSNENTENENKRNDKLQTVDVISAEMLRAWCGYQLNLRSSANRFRGATKRAKKAAGNRVRISTAWNALSCLIMVHLYICD